MIPNHQGGIVFVGPHEHHSNILPWKEAGAAIITISKELGDLKIDR